MSGVCDRCGDAYERQPIPDVHACVLCAWWWERHPGLPWLTLDGIAS